ncbi:AlbA family DNA-binding domain-containing protein [Brevundimonas sp.]|uniref:AlbA family DNA-binding domain-containing protein n=1 Tax=Brevundimonas sp. TaxID=1871086 RepID=UPI003F7131E2
MSKRTISDEEISLIKAMLARGMKNKDIQFFFNRQDRAVNSGRITDIGKGTYSTSANIPAADEATVNAFLATFCPNDVASGVLGDRGTTSTSPVSVEAITALFKLGDDQIWRLKEGESDTTECKAGFGLKHSHQWVKAIAALSNNRGGYVFFGVADGDHKGAAGQDLGYAVVGLGSDEFARIDPAEITNKLRSVLDPTPRIEIAAREIGGTLIGVIYVEQHPSRPIIAQKAEGGDKIKEGDIFYRYPGQSIRIKYSDLRAMLDQRDRQARLDIMPMVERLLALGPQRAMIADLDEGVLATGQGRIVLDSDLIERINFIREGAFDEVNGAPTLKLIGEVVPFNQDDIQSRGVITDDVVLRNFLAQQTVSLPKEYIRYAVVGGHAAWLPIGYFARRAGLSCSDVRTLVTSLQGQSARKKALLKRIDKADSARADFQGSPKSIARKLASGTLTEPTDAKSAASIAQAICALQEPRTLTLEDLLGLLTRCLAAIDAEGGVSALSYVRRAACRIDEMFFPLSN